MSYNKTKNTRSVDGLSRRSFTKISLAGIGAVMAGPGLRSAIAQGRGDAEITIGTTHEPSNFDAYYYGIDSYSHQRHLYDYLVDYDYNLNASPNGLASWSVASDNMSAEIELRSDIVLHSGRNWTVDDLLAGFDRAANKETGLQLHGPLSAISGWSKSGDNTIHLDFAEPISEAILTDILVTFPVTDASMNSVEDVLNTPSGSGAYKLVSRVPNDHFILERNEDYWRPGVPPIKRIKFQIFGSEDIVISALLSGAIQGADYFPGRAVERLGDGFGIQTGYVGALGRSLRHNVRGGPFQNFKFGQAFYRCIDRERIAKEVYHGFATPTYLPWAHGSVAHDASYEDKWSFDLNAAQQLIEASGETALDIAVIGGDQPGLREAQIIQADLAKIGFEAQIDVMDRATVGDRYVAGDYHTLLANIGNIGKRSPSAVASNSFMRTNSDNMIWGDQIPQEYIDQMNLIRTAPNAEVEKAASDAVNQIFTDTPWFVCYVHMNSLFAHDNNLTGSYRDVDDRLDLTGANFAS